jgi:hypothetical protein
VIRLEPFELAFTRAECVQLLDLMCEQRGLRGVAGAARFELRERRGGGAPVGRARPHVRELGREAAVMVEHRALHRTMEEGLMRLLSVEVEELLAQLAQRRERNR